jgi:hypothetical protein
MFTDIDAIDDVQVLAGLLREEHRALSRTNARIAAIGARARTIGAPRSAGHASVKGWLRAITGCSAATAFRQARLAAAASALPALLDSLAAGRVCVDNAGQLADLQRNPRARWAVSQGEQLLVDLAEQLPAADFALAAQRFAAHADADGCEPRYDAAMRRRRARLQLAGGMFHFEADGDTSAGSEIRAVHARFLRAEFDRDCAAAARGGTLARTAAQRRFDAFHRMCLAAARSGAVPLPDPLVHVVVDEATLQRQLAKATGGPLLPIDPATLLDRRCESGDGVQLDPRWVLHQAIAGRICQVVRDGNGMVVSVGRRTRFRGATRDAVLLMYQHCAWPGCDVPASECQIDHVDPWWHSRVTAAGNGMPVCAAHNRFKGGSCRREGPAPPGS